MFISGILKVWKKVNTSIDEMPFYLSCTWAICYIRWRMTCRVWIFSFHGSVSSNVRLAVFDYMLHMWFNKYICPMFESFDVNLTFKMLGGHLLIMLTHVWVACCFPVFSHLVRSGKYSLSGWQSGTGDKLIHTVCWWSVVQILSC